MTDELMNGVLMGAVTVGTTVLVGLGSIGIALMRKKLKLDATNSDLLLEANMRAKLQATLTTAAGKYLQGDVAGAKAYVLVQAADAMTHLSVSPEQLGQLIVDKAAAAAGVTTDVKPVA